VASEEGNDLALYRTRGFLFADLRGYTDFVDTHGDRAAAELLETYRRLVRDVVARFGGAEIKTEGDSFYIVLPSASSAVGCGLAIARAATTASADEPARPIRVAIGVHAGESTKTDDGYVGLAINTAARICAEAQAGEVLVSETVRSIARSGHDFAFAPRGRRRLKGIAEPVALYAATSSVAIRAPGSSSRAKGAPGIARSRIAAGVAAVVVATLTGAIGINLLIGGRASTPSAATSPRQSQAAMASPTASSIAGTAAPFLPGISSQLRIAMPGGPRLVATTTEAVWVALGDHVPGGLSTKIQRVDPVTNRVVTTIHLDSWASAIAGDGKDLWVALKELNQLVRIDGRTNQVGPPIAIGEPYDLASRAGSIWLTASYATAPTQAGLESRVVQISSTTGKIVQSIDLKRRVRDLVVDQQGIWVSGDAIWHIDRSDARVVSTFNIHSRPLAVGPSGVWIVDESDTIMRLDPVLGRVQARIAGPAGTPDPGRGRLVVGCRYARSRFTHQDRSRRQSRRGLGQHRPQRRGWLHRVGRQHRRGVRLDLDLRVRKGRALADRPRRVNERRSTRVC
jgi:class 3 adenylate cyclase